MATGVQPTTHGATRISTDTLARVRPLVPFVVPAAVFLGTRLALLRRFPPFLDESLYATWALRVHDSVNDRFVALAYGKLPLLSWLGAGLFPPQSLARSGPLQGLLVVGRAGIEPATLGLKVRPDNTQPGAAS